ncbi:MAG: DNA replication/repair protein RecF [Saprospiraceae bacterium]|nr:DNA replication/repair protein RecF [Saprospiraceae bacterium]
MHLLSLKLANFKNYTQQSVELSARLNCFVGLNGMGKTNLLDAVHVLCLTRSHRNLPDRNLVRHGESFFRLEGVFEQAGERQKIVAKLQLGQRKEVERNGAPFTRLTDFIGLFPVVMIAPDDVSLVQEGSEERRRFLDATLSQIYPDYLQYLLLYNGLLKQRNALLKTFAEQRRFDAALLEALDRQMPAPAQALTERRAAFAQAFVPLFQEMYAAIAGSQEQVSVAYESDSLEGDFAALLAAQLDKDRVLERTAVGPHRDDLGLALDGRPIKKFASQGQLKSFLLALRLAQYELLRREKGVAPLLLLDDIFDKLDEQRVRQLVGLLIGRDFGQIFITDTQRSRIEAVVSSFADEYRIFEVEAGGLVA